MENIEEIRKTLTFYVLANKLKTTIIDEDNNYSVADHIYGSMILAIAMDSEFKETDNLGKLLRMMVLDEFSRLNPNYSFQENLKKGNQFKMEIDEVRSLQTIESKLIFKYKMLDFLLTKMLSEKGNSLEYKDLLEEGIKILRFGNSLSYSVYEEIFKFYYLNFRLKNKVRTGWDKKHWNINSDRIERISEHIVGTIVLSIIMDSEFDYNQELDFVRNINMDEVIKMLAIHEVGEILIGDITPFDGITPEKKKEMEHSAIYDVIGNLTDKKNLLDTIFAFEGRFGNEGKFAHFCDKIEADLQSKFYQDSGLHHSLDDQSNNCVFKSSKVQEMLKSGAKTAFDIWYGWDINIYKDNKRFPEFANILRVIRDNNIFKLNNGVIKLKVELKELEHKYLVDELKKVIKILANDDYVDSVFMTNFITETNEKGEISFVVLLDSYVDYYDVDYYDRFKFFLETINDKFKNNSNIGIDVYFGCDYLSDYSIIPLNPSEVRRIEILTESSIIFDKSGTITKIKDNMKKKNNLYKYHLVEYEPPIDEPLKLIKK